MSGIVAPDRPRLATALREEPLHQFRLGESPFPDVVVYAGVLGVPGPPSRFASSGDTVAGHGRGNGLVGVPMEVPQRGVNRPGAILGGDASTADHGSGKKLGTMRDHIPSARASHR